MAVPSLRDNKCVNRDNFKGMGAVLTLKFLSTSTE